MRHHVTTELVTYSPTKSPAKAGTKRIWGEAGCDYVHATRVHSHPAREVSRRFACSTPWTPKRPTGSFVLKAPFSLSVDCGFEGSRG